MVINIYALREDTFACPTPLITVIVEDGSAPRGRCRVPKLDPRYCGRDQDAQEMVKLMLMGQGGNGSSQTAGNHASVMCLVGTAGLGKSQLALDIGRRMWQQGAAPGQCALRLLVC